MSGFKSTDLIVESEEENNFDVVDELQKQDSDDEYKNVGPGIPVAPKGTSKHQGMGFKFGGLMLDGESSSDENKTS